MTGPVAGMGLVWPTPTKTAAAGWREKRVLRLAPPLVAPCGQVRTSSRGSYTPVKAMASPMSSSGISISRKSAGTSADLQ